jgi:hypothetical protein
MAEILIKRVGLGWFKAVSDEDCQKTLAWSQDQLLKANITGAKKERSYRELCCYKGSCKYIANMNLDENKDTQKKVDFLTKVKCGFVEAMTVNTKNGTVFYQPKSLSYKNCDQPESHDFIAKALDLHSGLVGLTTDEYVRLLDAQK